MYGIKKDNHLQNIPSHGSDLVQDQALNSNLYRDNLLMQKNKLFSLIINIASISDWTNQTFFSFRSPIGIKKIKILKYLINTDNSLEENLDNIKEISRERLMMKAESNSFASQFYKVLYDLDYNDITSVNQTINRLIQIRDGLSDYSNDYVNV